MNKKSLVFNFGGIGNQLFQLSHLLSLYNYDPSQFVVCNNLSQQFSTKRDSIFKDFPGLASRFNIVSLKLVNVMSRIGIHPRIQAVIISMIRQQSLFTDRTATSVPTGLNTKSAVFYGYFQSNNTYLLDSARYFLENGIFDNFKTPDDHRVSRCSIHIRRGDFLTSRDHSALPIDYYLKAIEYFTSLGIYQYDLFGVGCNDFLDSLCNKFTNNQFSIISASPSEDLYAMSTYDYQIASNSTFSMWAVLFSYVMTLNDNCSHPSSHKPSYIVPSQIQHFFDSNIIHTL